MGSNLQTFLEKERSLEQYIAIQKNQISNTRGIGVRQKLGH